MTDGILDRRKYLSLLLLAALLGLCGAIITFAFIKLVHYGHLIVWLVKPKAVTRTSPGESTRSQESCE